MALNRVVVRHGFVRFRLPGLPLRRLPLRRSPFVPAGIRVALPAAGRVPRGRAGSIGPSMARWAARRTEAALPERIRTQLTQLVQECAGTTGMPSATDGDRNAATKTHASSTDPDARLARQSDGQSSIHAYALPAGDAVLGAYGLRLEGCNQPGPRRVSRLGSRCPWSIS